MRAFGRIAAALGVVLLGGGAGHASDIKLMALGMELGRVLAAEQPCGLSYDQAAISAFIAKRVPADDLSFMSNVEAGVGATEYEMKDMGASQKTVLCTQVARNAKAYGFVK